MRKSLAFAAILIGLFVSIYLTWAYTSPAHKMVCLGTGCDVVRSSEYAYPFGIPLPVFGLVFYAVLAALALAEPLLPERGGQIWRAIAVLSGAGVLFSAWLTYLEAFVIHGWCAWCVTQAIAVVITCLLALSVVRSESRPVAARPSKPSWKVRYGILAVAVVAGIPGLIFATRQHEAPPAPQQTAALPPGAGQLVRPDSHWTGNPNAKLTIVEFGDFQCPSCGVAEKANRAIRDQFGDRVRFVFREFPLEKIHAFAFQAAKAAECAGQQDKFWPMVETLYTNQTKLTAPDLRQYAGDLGLDQQKFNACLEDPAVSARIRTDMADAQALDVRATPTFFLNGKKTEGALDMMQVAAALSAASQTKAAGQESQPPAQQPAGAEKASMPATPGASTATEQAPGPNPQKLAPTQKAQSTMVQSPGPATQAGFAGAAGIGLGASAKNPFTPASASSPFVPCGLNETPVQDPPMIHVGDMRKLLDDKTAVFVDVRGNAAFKDAHIPTAVNATVDQLEKQIPPELPKSKQIVLYEAGGADDSCTVSKTAGRILMQNGFKEVKVFKEGFEGWKKEGLPVAR